MEALAPRLTAYSIINIRRKGEETNANVLTSPHRLDDTSVTLYKDGQHGCALPERETHHKSRHSLSAERTRRRVNTQGEFLAVSLFDALIVVILLHF